MRQELIHSKQSSDHFFRDEEGVIETFEFNYELSTKFEQDKWGTLLWLIPYPFWLGLPFFYMCGKANIRDKIYAQHLAITHDGIKYVVDEHAAGCRCDCARVGRVSKTVPFDKITDCDIEEPAGAAVCCFVPNVLATVNVDTASSGAKLENGKVQHELSISGLKDPKKFKSLVWQMKRQQVSGNNTSEVSSMANLQPVNNIMYREGQDTTRTNELLASIDKRLVEQNELLRQIANK